MKHRFPVVLYLFLSGIFFTPSLHCKETVQLLQNEAGFMTIEPITVSFHYGSYFARLELKSSQARIWYSFHVSDQDSLEKPLFVFFNGGPGSATSSGLMSMYTSRITLDNRIETGGGNSFIPNPFSWTRLGNLLYIDSRQAGFSYNMMNQVHDEAQRFREFNAQNFNPFLDAADFIRVLLRFLASHPELQNNPVVIVGESYGGVRTTVMLHLLLNYSDYGNGTQMYQDEALAEEIQAHFDAIFPEYQHQVVPPEAIVRQFNCQVLIQPALSYGYQVQITDELLRQPGSLVYKLGEEVGTPYEPDVHGDPLAFVSDIAGRDLYIYTKPRNWLTGFFGNAARLLRYARNLSLMTGVDVIAIEHLYALARTQAYRVINTDYEMDRIAKEASPIIRFHFLNPAILEAEEIRQESGDLDEVFGVLQPWDRYFISTNYHANWAFHVLNVAKLRGYEVEIFHPRFGQMFLQNVAHVNTFITNAAYDLVVYSEAIPPSLARHSNILESVEHLKYPLHGEERPGYIQLRYRPGAFPSLLGLEMRMIRFPIYAQSCHAVSLTQPEALLNDVFEWLEERYKEDGIGLERMSRESDNENRLRKQ